MASIYKRKRDQGKRGSAWWIVIYDENGRKRHRKGCSDKRVTLEIAARLQAAVERRRSGVVDPHDEAFAAAARAPIGEHIDAFVEHVRARGRADRYVHQVGARLLLFAKQAEARVLRDLTADRVSRFISWRRGGEDGVSGHTANEDIGTLKAFSRWAVQTIRLPSDPLASTRKLEARAIDPTRRRRALTADEVGTLIEATARRPAIELGKIRTGPRRGQVSANLSPETRARAARLGQERALGYLMALWTGLRRSELQDLRWGDVLLDQIPAKLQLRAAATKSKRADAVVLHPQVAEALRRWRVDDFRATDRVLVQVPTMKVLKADLKLAGIPFETETGRVDLHSMRKSVATYLATHGVTPRVAQAHMRHKDPRLTAGTYTDETVLPVAAEINALPWLPTTAPETAEQRAAATGTHGRADGVAAHWRRHGHNSVQSGAITCNDGASGGPVSDSEIPDQTQSAAVICNDVQEDAGKRVIGLEPTTFTLATCTPTTAKDSKSQDLDDPPDTPGGALAAHRVSDPARWAQRCRRLRESIASASNSSPETPRPPVPSPADPASTTQITHQAADLDLEAVQAAWPRLPAEVRAAVAALVRAADAGGPVGAVS